MVKYVVEERSHGSKRVLVVLVTVRVAHLSGLVEELHTVTGPDNRDLVKQPLSADRVVTWDGGVTSTTNQTNTGTATLPAKSTADAMRVWLPSLSAVTLTQPVVREMLSGVPSSVSVVDASVAVASARETHTV